MKKIILPALLLSSLAWSQDTGLITVPDLSTLSPSDGPEWPVELIKVAKVSYERNHKSSYCTRPVEMVDTVVIHHSESPPTDTPQDINSYHLDRGSRGEPWYMIAYTYVINAPYPNGSSPKSVVSEGRPFEIVGAHAGTEAYVPMTAKQKKIWNDGKILCGHENGTFKIDPEQIKGDNQIKANVTTIGVVVIGNYAPFSRENPGGYSKKNPRYPTKNTQEMIAKLSCQLQKKYPGIKNLRWHNYYHQTSCPGTLKNYVGQIKALAKGYGCDFN